MKIENVEKVFVFKAFLEVRVLPTNRLIERAGGSSTSKMALMCISGGLDGLKIKNVEKVIVFKAFLGVRLSPRNRLIERAGGVREGRGEGSPPPRDQRLGGLGIGRGQLDSSSIYTP